MDDDRKDPENADELEIDDLDLDLDESETEVVKGGSGGDFDNGMQGGIKHPH